jgi:hypothetical protein
MKIRLSLVPFVLGSLCYGHSSLAADDPFAKDLKATIALQGLPCSEVVEAKRNADSDYNVSCKDGNRYHVYVNDKGRVIVQKM